MAAICAISIGALAAVGVADPMPRFAIITNRVVVPSTISTAMTIAAILTARNAPSFILNLSCGDRSA